MNKKIITIIILLMSFINCMLYAQNNTNNSFDGKKLLGKKWYWSEIQDGVRKNRTMIFERDSITEIIVIGDKTIIRHDAYYLHDEGSCEFYPEFIGKNILGKYLYRCAEDGPYGVIIHKLTDNEFWYSFYSHSRLIKFTAYPLD